ncbi:FMN-binding protein MioC [Pseudomonas chlororaphis]|uniref:FMN-binding protein MioC n=1 Tax=Pseudomonas chlororaphis TaxID=587753 RepID=A0AB34C793_9PSED|nr:flavodoxin domain-containing protein [Pseudomonas chlororaphis]KAA5842471.1 FMN-binding protein MioC [Pseudomonas chlororaphis]
MNDKQITILVASTAGNAAYVADELGCELESLGWIVRAVRMEEVAVQDLQPGVYLICSSTYGVGEVPDNGKVFLEALNSRSPDLSGISYGVVGLGDSIYADTFCFGSKHFDEQFTRLGAARIGDILKHDRSSSDEPEDLAIEWLPGWLSLLNVKLLED